MAAKALLATGTMAGLGGVLKVLTNPVTGVLAALQIAISSRQWLLYERAARRARFELRLTGITAAGASERVRELRGQLGAGAAREVFGFSESLARLQSSGKAVIDEFANFVGLFDLVDDPRKNEFVDIFTSVATGIISSEEGLKRLKELFPTLAQDESLVTYAQALERIRDGLQEAADDQNQCREDT